MRVLQPVVCRLLQAVMNMEAMQGPAIRRCRSMQGQHGGIRPAAKRHADGGIGRQTGQRPAHGG